MRAIHMLLLCMALLDASGLNIFISGPVNIIHCSKDDGGLISVETTTHTTRFEEVTVDPKEFYEAARDGDINHITSVLARGNSSSRSSSFRISSVLTWHNEEDEDRTALHVAAKEGHDPIVLALLQTGASPNAKDGDGDTPVHNAADKGHSTALQVLLQPQYQAIVNMQGDSGWTAVWLAAWQGHNAALQVLLDHGGDVHTPEDKGWSPLMAAAWSGQVATAQALITAGARLGDVDNDGRTALHGAARDNHQDVARLLLENGADKAQKNNWGSTPADDARDDELAAIINQW